MGYKYILGLALMVLLSACTNQPVKQGYVSLPVFEAWFDDKIVFYVTTDISDRKMAKEMNANYVPRLRNTIPKYPKPPSVRTALERVYAFPNSHQTRNVFPSAPDPVGAENRDKQYSPLWLMYNVVWLDSSKAYTLKSEGAIYDAEEKGLVSIERTNIVVNCPVVHPPI
ncbi:hypothetical protein O1D97_13250 [Marinomonas sp. 15G1-11]|uniref:DUF7482 domain-containing protein n=1 Tax=Marinomonas phaeophyticola TaxID=3004091 RepID=A0ABT4JVY9_9GAMM|nr:hypothetical protein [Marinomonas sp. 15G1-11]MCZ2722547.1 hypothetical protein [Marinomonas sp. 15G1-11]